MVEGQELKKAGLRATSPRIKILQIFEKQKLSPNQRHMSAEDIYRALLEAKEEVGLATVYRVLTQFESAGLLIRHNFEGGQSLYELDDGKHHDHLVCLKCGNLDEFVDDVIESQQHKVAESKGFKMTDHTLTIYGICADCSERTS